MKRWQGRRFSLMTFVIRDRKIIDTLKIMTKQGFTLLELLLVISIILAIISLIIGLVLISLNITRKIHCANNLRQIYLATKIYEEEFGAPPWFPKHFVTWKPEYASLLICPSDPYQGNLLKDIHDPKAFIPHSYFFNYWNDYHFVRLPRKNIHGPKEFTEKMLKQFWYELTAPDGHWFVCPWHSLAVFPDGRVGRARRYTGADFENPENKLR
ncbi:MAG: hypothetical protein HZLCBSQH_000475 [Candidatus Fervidibacterota bacterium]